MRTSAEQVLREAVKGHHPNETFEKVARLGLLVSSQPNFTYSLGPYNASPGLTPERLADTRPSRAPLGRGERASSR